MVSWKALFLKKGASFGLKKSSSEKFAEIIQKKSLLVKQESAGVMTPAESNFLISKGNKWKALNPEKSIEEIFEGTSHSQGSDIMGNIKSAALGGFGVGFVSNSEIYSDLKWGVKTSIKTSIKYLSKESDLTDPIVGSSC